MSTIKELANQILAEKTNKIIPDKFMNNWQAFNITGNIPNNGGLNYNPTTNVQNIPAGYTTGGVINAVTSNIDVNITAGNIKNGVTILNITGTYQGSGGGGSGDVKLFDTIANMQADPSPNEGDLAIVYRDSSEGIIETSEFSSCIFPNTVVLPQAYSDSTYGSFRSTSFGWFDAQFSLSSSSFSFEGYGNESIQVQYTSSNGITYTRTDGGSELVDFGTTIQFESWGDPFPDELGYFMRIGSKNFDGLYECHENYVDSSLLQFISLDDVAFSQTTPTWNGNYINTYYDVNKIKELIGNLMAGEGYTSMDANLYLNNNNEVCLFANKIYDNTRLGTGLSYYMLNINNNEFLGISASTSTSSTVESAYLYTLDLENMTYTETVLAPSYYFMDNSTTRRYYVEIVPKTLMLEIVKYSDSDIQISDSEIRYAYFSTPNSSTVATKAATNYITLSASVNPIFNFIYTLASSQLNATSDLVYNSVFYGKNGVETGTLQNNECKMREQVINKSLIYSSISSLELNPSLTSLATLYSGQSSLTSVPNINTSKVTNMYGMFWECHNLLTIPNYDTSNVVNMVSMFQYCDHLSSIPLINTSKVTNTYQMFYDCHDLIEIPQLDTHLVTYAVLMFAGCNSLETLPELNTSNITAMGNMLYNCINLSNSSLDNILSMCATSAVTTNKTLKNLGLTSNQANICKTLSNYSAFTSAGWTTGY